LETSSRPVEQQLVYEDEIVVRLPAYQWVSIKLFALPSEPVDDHAALNLLLQHVRYRDSYASSVFKDSMNLHGPYRLDTITTDSFTLSDGASAETTIRTWAEQLTPVPDAACDELQRELYPRIRNASRCYRLADPGKDALHDWGDVVGKTGFNEFVLIDRDGGSLALVVASDD
jgi:hypothetical protein